MTTAIETRIHEGQHSALPDLRDAWRQCLSACPAEQQLFTFDWYDAWIRTYGARPPWTGRVRVVTAHTADGATCAILPMIERRSQGLLWLSLAGFYQPIRSFPGLPALAQGVGAAFARALFHDLAGWDALRFGTWDDAAPERAGLIRALEQEARHYEVELRGRTIVTRVKPTIEAYSGSRTIKRIQTYARRFAREPGAEIRHFSNPDAATAAAMFRDLGTVEQQSWLASKGGQPRFSADIDRAFWQRVTETTLTPGRNLDVWLAYWQHKPVAFAVVLTSGSVDYLIANQFAEQAKAFRLGWILYLNYLQVAIARGIRVIDSAPGELHYKSLQGGEEAEMRHDLFVFPNSPKGWLLKQLLRGLRMSKRFLEAKPWGKDLAARLLRV